MAVNDLALPWSSAATIVATDFPTTESGCR
jgi:hypothetical protein